jgi:hypothetical protein
MSTGFWIAKISGPWVDQVWFEAPSRIIRGGDGTRLSSVWDEGWNFSVQLAQMGVKCAYTREIAANHIGFEAWGNQVPLDTAHESDSGDMDYSWILSRTPSNGQQRQSSQKSKILQP